MKASDFLLPTEVNNVRFYQDDVVIHNSLFVKNQLKTKTIKSKQLHKKTTSKNYKIRNQSKNK